MTTKSKKSSKLFPDILIRHYKNRNKKKHRSIRPNPPKGTKYTYARARNKEWNDSIALDMQKEIKNLNTQKTEDPSTFDRFAMK